ncbi:MAG: prepilin-type N-terminal cleavage/methylation domain-containing protein [Thermoanaerobaculia bacterium]
MKRRQLGYSLMEVIVAMTVFGMFLATIFVLTADMRRWEKRLPVNLYRNPQIMSVLSRLRRDVQDAHGAEPYLNEYAGYKASSQVLILESVQPNGYTRTIVWDFRTPGSVRRREYNVGVSRDWVQRGLPQELQSIKVAAVSTKAAAWACVISAYDDQGRLAIYQVLQPRATFDFDETATDTTGTTTTTTTTP